MLRTRSIPSDGGERRIRVHVTSAGAIAQLADRVLGTSFDFVVGAGSVISGVTSGTVGPIRWSPPRGLIRVGRVAPYAREGAAVIAGIFRRRVSEGQRRPSRRGVTYIAVARCDHVVD